MGDILPRYEEPLVTDDEGVMKTHAATLMDMAGLDDDIWTVEMGSGKRYLAQTAADFVGPEVVNGKIRISRAWFSQVGMEKLMEVMGEDADRTLLENAIRHEIAHAIDYERRSFEEIEKHPHDHVWKRLAVACHARPQSCEYGLPTELLAKWKRVCSYCGTVFKYLHRYATRDGVYVCPDCESPVHVTENEECLL